MMATPNPHESETLHEMAGRLSVENSHLRESQSHMMKVLAALAHEAGGELSVAERTLALQESSPGEVVMWMDNSARRLRLRIRERQSQNEKLSESHVRKETL